MESTDSDAPPEVWDEINAQIERDAKAWYEAATKILETLPPEEDDTATLP
jgi:hypothetical protein